MGHYFLDRRYFFSGSNIKKVMAIKLIEVFESVSGYLFFKRDPKKVLKKDISTSQLELTIALT